MDDKLYTKDDLLFYKKKAGKSKFILPPNIFGLPAFKYIQYLEK